MKEGSGVKDLATEGHGRVRSHSAEPLSAVVVTPLDLSTEGYVTTTNFFGVGPMQALKRGAEPERFNACMGPTPAATAG